jgi:hypothetical protein
MTAVSWLVDAARALVEKLNGRWSNRGGRCRCPAHTDRTPSLSVRVVAPGLWSIALQAVHVER